MNTTLMPSPSARTIQLTRSDVENPHGLPPPCGDFAPAAPDSVVSTRMGARFRVAVVLSALVAMSAGGVAAAAVHQPAPTRKCKPARSARCLRLARGHEPVIVSTNAR